MDDLMSDTPKNISAYTESEFTRWLASADIQELEQRFIDLYVESVKLQYRGNAATDRDEARKLRVQRGVLFHRQTQIANRAQAKNLHLSILGQTLSADRQREILESISDRELERTIQTSRSTVDQNSDQLELLLNIAAERHSNSTDSTNPIEAANKDEAEIVTQRPETITEAPLLPNDQQLPVTPPQAEALEVVTEPIHAQRLDPPDEPIEPNTPASPAPIQQPQRVASLPPNTPITLGIDVATQQPVTLAGESKDLGLYIIGAPGVGKSTLMLNMVLQDISQGHGVCVLDPHGDLINDILGRSDADPDRVILLDPADYQHPFGLNLFECKDTSDPTLRSRTTSYVMGIFQKLWGDDGLHPSWGAQLEDILRHLTQTFVHAQKYTLVDAPLFLEDDHFRDAAIMDLSPQIQEYRLRSYNPRKDKPVYISSTLNKVRKFTDDEILYPILGQTTSTVNFPNAMDENKIMLVSLPVGRIGDEAVSLLGSLIISQLIQATFGRVELDHRDRNPMSLYCDEYYYFATSDFPRFFAEGRKFKVSTVIAHQARYQLDSMSKQATLNVANRVAFRISGKDAQELHHEFTYLPPAKVQVVVNEPFDAMCRTPYTDENTNVSIKYIVERLDRFKREESTDHYMSRQLTEMLNDFVRKTMAGTIKLGTPESQAYIFEIIKRMA
jgi:hypothetical protein